MTPEALPTALAQTGLATVAEVATIAGGVSLAIGLLYFLFIRAHRHWFAFRKSWPVRVDLLQAYVQIDPPKDLHSSDHYAAEAWQILVICRLSPRRWTSSSGRDLRLLEWKGQNDEGDNVLRMVEYPGTKNIDQPRVVHAWFSSDPPADASSYVRSVRISIRVEHPPSSPIWCWAGKTIDVTRPARFINLSDIEGWKRGHEPSPDVS